MNTYVIKRLPEGVDLPDFKGELDRAWAECPAAEIGNYIWDENGYKPHAEAHAMYSDAGLHVYMRAWENEVRAVADYCGRICQDSCLEFFVRPNMDVDRYTNIEMNPLGKFMCGIGRRPLRSL